MKDKTSKACLLTAGVNLSSDLSLSPCSKNSLVTSSATLGYKCQPSLFHYFTRCNMLMLMHALKATGCMHFAIFCASDLARKIPIFFRENMQIPGA